MQWIKYISNIFKYIDHDFEIEKHNLGEYVY